MKFRSGLYLGILGIVCATASSCHVLVNASSGGKSENIVKSVVSDPVNIVVVSLAALVSVYALARRIFKRES